MFCLPKTAWPPTLRMGSEADKPTFAVAARRYRHAGKPPICRIPESICVHVFAVVDEAPGTSGVAFQAGPTPMMTV